MSDVTIDADGHILEPRDLWERYVESRFRSRAIRVRRGRDDRDVLEIDGRLARYTTTEMLGAFGGMGLTREELARAAYSGQYEENAPAPAVDPKARLELLDRDGITRAILYPSLGLQWEAEVEEDGYALAHCRAYNRWICEFCAGSEGRLVPIAHLTLGDAAAAAEELRRAVAEGARGGFLLPFTRNGVPHGHPDHDPLFAAAVELGVPLSIHTGIDPGRRSLHHRFDGLSWPEAIPAGAWYLQMMFPQAVQQALTTFFQYGTFDRFPELRLVVLESGASWLGHWMDRMDGMARGPLGLTLPLRDRPSDYVRRQCWISADPDETALPAIIEHVGSDRFVWATDYPHSDHGGDYMKELHELGERLSPEARQRFYGTNAAALYALA